MPNFSLWQPTRILKNINTKNVIYVIKEKVLHIHVFCNNWFFKNQKLYIQVKIHHLIPVLHVIHYRKRNIVSFNLHIQLLIFKQTVIAKNLDIQKLFFGNSYTKNISEELSKEFLEFRNC